MCIMSLSKREASNIVYSPLLLFNTFCWGKKTSKQQTTDNKLFHILLSTLISV